MRTTARPDQRIALSTMADVPARDRRLLVVTPCRNEAAYARQTIQSVLAQTVLPTLWLIVDDGSTDATPQILAEYEQKHDFIRVIRREDRGRRVLGGGVVETFYAGFDACEAANFDYLCKLDLDVDLPERYFEILMDRMEADLRIGTCSGKPYFSLPGRKEPISEKCGDEMSVGMTKFYRMDCFHDIGGFVPQVMWDGIDCHRCRMQRWIACSWADPELQFLHLRPMGTSDRSWWRGRMRHGFGQYFMGTSPAYMTASALYRMFRPPVLLGGLAMWLGYVKAMITRPARYEDRQFRRFLRRYQWQCLFRGKHRATEQLHRLADVHERPSEPAKDAN